MKTVKSTSFILPLLFHFVFTENLFDNRNNTTNSLLLLLLLYTLLYLQSYLWDI